MFYIKRKQGLFYLSLILILTIALACISDSGITESTSSTTQQAADSGTEDSGIEDSGIEDSGTEDSGIEDSGTEDSGTEDSGIEDSGTEDSGTEDSGIEDSGIEDSGTEDSGIEDSGAWGLPYSDGTSFGSDCYIYVANEGSGGGSGSTIVQVMADGSAIIVGNGFNGPSGLAIDSTSTNLFISDDNHGIYQVDTSGDLVTLITELDNPNALSFNQAGQLLVAEAGNRIMRYDFGSNTYEELGTGFNIPQAVAPYGDDLYFSDHTGYIFLITPTDPLPIAAPATAYRYTSSAELSGTQGGLLADASGNLYAADYLGRVIRVDAATGLVDEIVNLPGFQSRGLVLSRNQDVLFVTGYASNTILAIELGSLSISILADDSTTGNLLDGPFGMVITCNDYPEFSLDGGSIGDFVEANAGPDQSVTVNDTVFLDGIGSYSSTTELNFHWFFNLKPATSNAVWIPSPNVVDPTFVADIPGHYQVVLEVSSETAVAFDTTDIFAYKDRGSFAALAEGQFLYVANEGAGGGGSTIIKVFPDGSAQTVGTGFNGPSGITIDPYFGDLLISDDDGQVYRVNGLGVTTILAPTFNNPNALAIDANNNLVVAEAGGDISIVDLFSESYNYLATGFPTPQGLSPLGTDLVFSDMDGYIYLITASTPVPIAAPATENRYLSAPVAPGTEGGLVTDSYQNTYIATYSDNRVLMVAAGSLSVLTVLDVPGTQTRGLVLGMGNDALLVTGYNTNQILAVDLTTGTNQVLADNVSTGGRLNGPFGMVISTTDFPAFSRP